MKTRQVVMIRGDDPLFERLFAGNGLVAAVTDAVLPGDDELDVAAAAAQKFGAAHVNVGVAPTLPLAGRICDDLDSLGNTDRSLVDGSAGPRPPEGGVDPIKD